MGPSSTSVVPSLARMTRASTASREGSTTGRKASECAALGVTTIASTSGWTIGPPALAL